MDERLTDAERQQRLGQTHLDAGRPDEARRAYERAVELAPDDPFGYFHFGHYFYSTDRPHEALEQFRRGTALLPGHAIGYRLQGDAYRKLKQPQPAQEAYETALRLDPDDESSRRALAAVRDAAARAAIFQARKNDQAATVVLLAARWLETHPNDLGVMFDYAEMLYQMTRYDDAIRVYQDAHERFPSRRWAVCNQMGHLYRYRGDFATAEEWFRKAAAVEPDDATSYIFLGAVQARQGKLLEAEQTHRRAAQCAEGCIDEAHHNLGLVLRGQGRLAEAAASFRTALELCPKYTEAEEALQDVETALALSGDRT